MKTILMTKARAVEVFQLEHLPRVRSCYERDGIVDYPARREEWNLFTDALCRAGLITQSQYARWGHPSCCVNPRTA